MLDILCYFDPSIGIRASSTYQAMVSSSGSKPTTGSISAKISLFDENNFAMWKSKAMIVLETKDYNVTPPPGDESVSVSDVTSDHI